MRLRNAWQNTTPAFRISLLSLILLASLATLAWLATSRDQIKTKRPLAYLQSSTAPGKLGPRRWQIIDVHEHLSGEAEARRLLQTMDRLGVAKAALMASTTYTLTLDPKYGFEGFRENGERLLAIKRRWPDRFLAFVTFDPCSSTDHLAYVRDAVSRGADGVKLYLGHGGGGARFKFHCQPLNHSSMMPFWAWAEKEQLPLLVHVNLELFGNEMEAVLERHPQLRIAVPHFGLLMFSDQRQRRLSDLLRRYPNLYTDVSFGHHSIQIDGFERLAERQQRSRDFIIRHRDKIMFASDMVLTEAHSDAFIASTLRSYMEMLELPAFRLFLRPQRPMRGMALDEATLEQIYEVTPRKFLRLDEPHRRGGGA